MDLRPLFGGSYTDLRVLVTGHTGFKGSWLCLWLQQMGAQITGLALPADTTPSHWGLLQLDGVRNLEVDLRDSAALRAAIDAEQPHMVFHLAAQPLVRRSYRDPVGTFATNVTGLVNLFEAVRGCASVRALVNATTDKVYLDQTTEDGYHEQHPLGGHDPYSTSKACAELVSECYRKSFFSGVGQSQPRVATARAGNVIGGGDWSEDRLVPDLVRSAMAGAPLRVRNPHAVRPWQHVLEPLSGYLRLGQALLAGERAEGPWNFGPATDATMPVAGLVARMRELWPGVRDEPCNDSHPHEAATLRLDCGKAARELGWHPVWNATQTVERTIGWYRAFHEGNTVLSHSDLSAYVADARAAKLDWATSP
ncbi:CDP-glucose 4,6-dehydratase [Montanilutibacter psychrotolerans]|nr:CDP-glucose 4,6-dehydratase [Lysobacter psychrotolerans]